MSYDWKKELERYRDVDALSPLQRLERNEIIAILFSGLPRFAFDSAKRKSFSDYMDWLTDIVARTLPTSDPNPEELKKMGVSASDYFKHKAGMEVGAEVLEKINAYLGQNSQKEKIAAEAIVKGKYTFKNGRLKFHLALRDYHNASFAESFLNCEDWVNFCGSISSQAILEIKNQVADSLVSLEEEGIDSVSGIKAKYAKLFDPGDAVGRVCDFVISTYSGGEIRGNNFTEDDIFEDEKLSDLFESSVLNNVANPAAKKLKIYFKKAETPAEKKVASLTSGYITYSRANNLPLLSKSNPRNIFTEFSVSDGKLIEKTKKQVNLPDKSEISQIKEKLASPTVGLRERIALNKRLAELNEMR
jgi:hypothetical protein